MKFVDYRFLSFALCLASISCSDNTTEAPLPDDDDIPEVSVAKSVTINPEIKYQTIKGFAASDCWSPSYIGK